MSRSARAGIVVVGTAVLAFLVAGAIKRNPPDFATLPSIAVVRDDAGRALWEIRLARRAHEICAEAIGAAPAATGRAYQLWLATPAGPRSLGLLPSAGGKMIPEIPALADRLAGRGMLWVSREPPGGSDREQPSGPVLFRAAFPQPG